MTRVGITAAAGATVGPYSKRPVADEPFGFLFARRLGVFERDGEGHLVSGDRPDEGARQGRGRRFATGVFQECGPGRRRLERRDAADHRFQSPPRPLMSVLAQAALAGTVSSPPYHSRFSLA